MPFEQFSTTKHIFYGELRLQQFDGCDEMLDIWTEGAELTL